MVTAQQSKADLLEVGAETFDTVEFTLRRSSGSFENRRLVLLDAVPEIIGYYSEGSAALAADFYDESRAAARVDGRFRAELVLLDRTVNIRRGVAWASEPLSVDDDALALERFQDIVRSEIARPYRDTVLNNRLRDSEAVGYRRIASPSSCGFCQMLAARGAIYREETAFFAAHGNCRCTVQPVFRGERGEEANVIEYMASRRNRTPAQRERIRKYIAENYPEEAERPHVRTSR